MWKHLPLYLVSRKGKTAAGFGMKLLNEKESRKVGKIRKYEKNLFEGIIRQA